jgi:phospholipid/cholesterol/gamma-HCH transport system substrate-binding protein
MDDNETQPYQITYIDRLVGIIVLAVLAVIVAAIILRYQEIGPGVRRVNYYTVLNQAHGIVRGADVRLAGIPIGQIESVTLRKDGSVRVDVAISHEFQEFIVEGCRVRVASTIGLGALIGWTGLHLLLSEIPEGEILEEGSYIEALQPVGLAETFSDVELNKMAENVKTILQNLTEISRAIGESEDAITASLENVAGITQDLRATVNAISAAAESAQTGFIAWTEAGQSVQGVVDASEADIKVTTVNARKASEQLNALLLELEDVVERINRLLAQIEAGGEHIPALLSDSRILVERANELTERLNRHWLLGGPRKEKKTYMPSVHPIRDPEAPSPAVD